MNTQLIPSYDMLGLPAPPWLVQVLMALTLALHWMFLGGALGGTAIAIASAFRAKDTEWADLGRRLLPLIPFSLSIAMTLGIAPLLFVQILYGQFFYTANILLGVWWLALLAFVMAAFGLLWLAWARAQRGHPIAWPLLALAILVLLHVAFILSTNATLLQNPGRWESVRAAGMNRLPPADATLVPRLLFAASGFAAVGGLFVALVSRLGLLPARGRKAGIALALPALVAQCVFGVALIAAMPGGQRAAALGGSLESAFFWIGAAAIGGAVPLAWLARRTDDLRATALPAIAAFVGLLSIAAVRDLVRRVALAPDYKLASVSQHPEWSSFILFLAVFVLGLGVIAWVVRLGHAREGHPVPPTA